MIELTLLRKNIEAALSLIAKPKGGELGEMKGSFETSMATSLSGEETQITRKNINLVIELGEFLNNEKAKARDEEWAEFVDNEEMLGLNSAIMVMAMKAASNELLVQEKDKDKFVELVHRCGLNDAIDHRERIRDLIGRLENITVKSDESIRGERGEWRDAVEEMPEFKAVIKAVRKQVNLELRGHPRCGGLGYCHVEWDTIQRILRDEHGIRWRTPPQMNRGVMFD